MEYLHLHVWQQYLLQGLLIFAMLAAAAVTLTKAGRNPYLALLMVVPFVQIIAVWAFAFTAWKKKT